jgi:hypothetical protein
MATMPVAARPAARQIAIRPGVVLGTDRDLTLEEFALDMLPNLKNIDLSRSCLPGQIADVRKLWPVSRDVVEPSDQDKNSQGILSGRVLKSKFLVQSHKDVKRRLRHQRAIRECPPAQEDAHSFICSPANSKKRWASLRSKDGTVSRNSSSEKPAARWSISGAASKSIGPRFALCLPVTFSNNREH